jgi:RNA-binding protein
MTSTLTPQKVADLKKESHSLKPILQIGKNGLTDATMAELMVHLKKRKLVKVKLLKSVLDTIDKEELFAQITEKAKCEVILVAGFVVVLYKR